jgi:4-oxalomesaconate hydratase
MEFSNERLLVVSAHATDFVWRAGGAIALYASRGARARVLYLSYGERGESQGLWKKEGMTLERVKQARHEEATKAAGVLGAEIRCFDAGDYPLGVTPQLTEELVQEFRSFQPTCVLTHTPVDPYNGDHVEASKLTMNARVYAQAMGYPSEHRRLGAPPVFDFEPH